VVEFVVQLEVEARGAWRSVIRYDTAHGYAHIDRYNLRGRSKKDRLGFLNPSPGTALCLFPLSALIIHSCLSAPPSLRLERQSKVKTPNYFSG